MAFFFPFSNLHELNLDWVLNQVKKFSELIPPMEEATTNVQTALDDATEAVNKADQALNDAGDALTTAQEAKDLAEQAAQGTIADGAVTTVKIADGAVTTVKIADGAVTGNKIGSATIQTGNLSAGCVTTAKILDDAITSAKIADGAVHTNDLYDSVVTTPKINDAAVTLVKLAADAKESSGTGYWKSPGGLLICWGTVNIEREPGVNTAIATYAQPFNGNPFAAIAMYQASHPESWEYGVSDFENPTTITLKLYNAASSALADTSISYVAFGFAA